MQKLLKKILDYLQGDLKKEITPLLKHSNEAIEYFPENPDVEFFELLKTVSTCSKDISEKASNLLVYIEVLSMKNRYKSENLIKNGLTKVEKSYFQYFMLKHNEHKNRADDINIYFEPATVRIDKKNLDYVIDEFLNFMLKTTDSGKVIRCAGIKIDQHYLIVIKENRFDGSILKEEEITCFGALAGGECSLHRCSINLLVAKKIIEMNGGELTVGTKNGDNKMFRIKLNLANEF